MGYVRSPGESGLRRGHDPRRGKKPPRRGAITDRETRDEAEEPRTDLPEHLYRCERCNTTILRGNDHSHERFCKTQTERDIHPASGRNVEYSRQLRERG